MISFHAKEQRLSSPEISNTIFNHFFTVFELSMETNCMKHLRKSLQIKVNLKKNINQCWVLFYSSQVYNLIWQIFDISNKQIEKITNVLKTQKLIHHQVAKMQLKLERQGMSFFRIYNHCLLKTYLSSLSSSPYESRYIDPQIQARFPRITTIVAELTARQGAVPAPHSTLCLTASKLPKYKFLIVINDKFK